MNKGYKQRLLCMVSTGGPCARKSVPLLSLIELSLLCWNIRIYWDFDHVLHIQICITSVTELYETPLKWDYFNYWHLWNSTLHNTHHLRATTIYHNTLQTVCKVICCLLHTQPRNVWFISQTARGHSLTIQIFLSFNWGVIIDSMVSISVPLLVSTYKTKKNSVYVVKSFNWHQRRKEYNLSSPTIYWAIRVKSVAGCYCATYVSLLLIYP